MSSLVIGYLVGTLVGAWIILRHWRYLIALKYRYWPRYELCLKLKGDDVRRWHIEGFPYRLTHTRDEIVDILTNNEYRIDRYKIVDRWTGDEVTHLIKTS